MYLGEQYVNNLTLSDVTFLVEGQTFHAHRIALLASSDTFRAMFDGHYKEKEASTIPIPNIRFVVFESMMRCIYTGAHWHHSFAKHSSSSFIQVWACGGCMAGSSGAFWSLQRQTLHTGQNAVPQYWPFLGRACCIQSQHVTIRHTKSHRSREALRTGHS